LNQPASVHTT